MAGPTEVTFLANLAGLVAALAAAGWLAHRFRLPAALGYLAVGLAIPTQVGTAIVPAESIATGSNLAILVLLFFIGLELDLQRLRELLRTTAVATAFNIAVPALAVTAIAKVLGWTTFEAIALGLTASVSSTIFGERISAMGSFRPASRRRMLGILLGEDLAAAGLLAIIVVLGGGIATVDWFDPVFAVGRVAFLLLILTAGALFVVPRLLDAVARTHQHELVVLTSVAAIIGLAAAGAWGGAPELGALVAGVAAAEAGSRFVIRSGLLTLREVALAVFFLASGVVVDLDLVQHSLPLGALIAGVFLATKMLVNVPASLAAGQSFPEAVQTALGLGTIGEFSLILVAASEAQGVAHPAMRATIMAALVLLLAVTPVLALLTPRLTRLGGDMPESVRRPLLMLMHGLRRNRIGATPDRKRQSRQTLLVLVANLVLLTAWTVLAASVGPGWVARFPQYPIGAPIVGVGLAVGVAGPLLWATYRSYRRLVHQLAGVDGTGDRAARIRARVIDAAVAVSIALLLIPLSLLLPLTLPVLVAGLLVAIALSAVVWRQLGSFHRALESTVTRVLGRDEEASAILDRVMEQYPWGVRFSAVALPQGSPVAGHSIDEARIEELTGATVAVLQRRGHEIVNPPGAETLYTGDTVVLMGDTHQLERAEALLVAHGDAIRLTAQSRLATVAEVTVHPGSPLVGQTLAQADMHGRTGTMPVGVWPSGGRHPAPFRPDIVLREGDRLILLGSALQVARARLLAEGEEQTSVVEAADEPESHGV